MRRIGKELIPTRDGNVNAAHTSAQVGKSEGSPPSAILPDTKPVFKEPPIEGIKLEPVLVGKRFEEGKFEEFIWLDIDWSAKRVRKPIRALKGRLHLADLFGETNLAIGWTMNRPINEGDRFTQKGSGFKHNQFMDSHVWVRNTGKQNMKLTFEVVAVVYQDGSLEGGKEDVPRNSILVPTLLDKRFQQQDSREFVWMDIEWDTSSLKKATRAVKGVLHVTDLFGEPQLNIDTTIDVPLDPGKPYTEKGLGFGYNQLIDSHTWVRATAKDDMRLVFVPTAVIYADGTREDM